MDQPPRTLLHYLERRAPVKWDTHQVPGLIQPSFCSQNWRITKRPKSSSNNLIPQTGFKQTHTKKYWCNTNIPLGYFSRRKEIYIFTINLVISHNHLFYKIYVLIPHKCHKKEMLMQRIMHIMIVLHYYNTHKSWAAWIHHP